MIARAAVRRPNPLVRAGDLAGQAQRRLEQLLDLVAPGAPETAAGRRGLAMLVCELKELADTHGWREECAVTVEILQLLESPSKLVGLGRRIRMGLVGLERRLRDRLVAVMPSLLSGREWDRRVA